MTRWQDGVHMRPSISEEDVLAFLVLVGARPLVTNIYATAQLLEQDAWRAATPPNSVPGGVAEVATNRMLTAPSLEAAIADSERRYEAERAREAVLVEARRLRGDTFGPLGNAARRLLDAERLVGELDPASPCEPTKKVSRV